MKGHRGITILLSGDARLKELNGLFRGKNKPTNVLSFPAEANADDYLGDVAIAHGVVAREAADAGKSRDIWRIWRSMACCIFWGTTMKNRRKRCAWKGWSAKFLLNSASPIPMLCP